jgi:hypothetical protein
MNGESQHSLPFCDSFCLSGHFLGHCILSQSTDLIDGAPDAQEAVKIMLPINDVDAIDESRESCRLIDVALILGCLAKWPNQPLMLLRLANQFKHSAKRRIFPTVHTTISDGHLTLILQPD